MTTDIKFSQLPDAAALDGTEIVPIVQGGQNVKTTLNSAAQQPFETGNFTPILKGSVIEGVNAYLKQQGSFTRFGDLCFIRGEVRLDGSSGALNSEGSLEIAGLPFTGISDNFNAGITVLEIPTGLNQTAQAFLGRLHTDSFLIRQQTDGGSNGLQHNEATDSLWILFAATYKLAV